MKHLPGITPQKSEPSVGVTSLGLFGSTTSIAQAIAMGKNPASVLAATPFDTHAIVFAACNIISMAGSQAPLRAYSDRVTNTKQLRQFGKNRESYARLLRGASIDQRVLRQSFRLIARDEHPLAKLLYRPNPYINGTQLVSLMLLWLHLRGEVFLIKTNEEGGPVMGRTPTYLWPISGDLVTEIYEHGSYGPLVGWEIDLPDYLKQHGLYEKAEFDLNQVVHVKFPDPKNPLRGLSRLQAVARNIESDIDVDKLNSALAKRGGQPKGLLHTEKDLTTEQKDEVRSSFNASYGAAEMAGKIPVLFGGLTYKPISLTPQEMQFLEQKQISRREILAVLGVGESSLGFTEASTYATQLGQDRNLWDKTILPELRVIEETLDTELFFNESDEIFPAFDLTGIEALRVGLVDKIASAAKACESSLHMTPKVSFALHGLEVEDYAGNDKALANSGLLPVDMILTGEHIAKKEDDPEKKPSVAKPGGDNKEGADDKKDPDLKDQPIASKEENILKGTDLLDAHELLESSLMKAYKRWLAAEQRILLDSLTIKSNAFDPRGLLSSAEEMFSRLKTTFRSWYNAAYNRILKLTEKELDGIPFDTADDLLLSYKNANEFAFVDAYSKSLNDKLTVALRESFEAGETIEQVTLKVKGLFETLGDSTRSVSAIRFQVTSFLNGLRFHIFKLVGIGKKWLTVKDEKVREAHQILGSLKDKPLDHNYLKDLGREAEGFLAFPGDIRAPGNLTFGCRCFLVKGKK